MPAGRLTLEEDEAEKGGRELMKMTRMLQGNKKHVHYIMEIVVFTTSSALTSRPEAGA